MQASHALQAFKWLVVKDLVCEFRLCRAWPGMLLLGLVLVLLLAMQVDLPAEDRLKVVSGLLWLDVFFAGTLVLDRSFTGEREEGCWGTLLLYPVPRTVLFFAKVAVNFLSLFLLECVLTLAVVVFSNVDILQRPGPLLVIALLANLGYSSIGVLVSALTARLSQTSSLLALLLLPLVTPVILSAAEATRLLVALDGDNQWQRWAQLLACFAILFTSLGMLMFDCAIEE